MAREVGEKLGLGKKFLKPDFFVILGCLDTFLVKGGGKTFGSVVRERTKLDRQYFFIPLGRLHYLSCTGGRTFWGYVKILALSLIFGSHSSPFVHFIHQKLNSVEKKNCPPPQTRNASFFAPPKTLRQFFCPPPKPRRQFSAPPPQNVRPPVQLK